MRIDALSLENFRNYAGLEIRFHPKVNVICGDNAQGKTNLLEAVSYLSGVSPRARYDRELIRFHTDAASLRGQADSRERTFRLEAVLRRGQRRQLSANGVRLNAMAELSQIMNTVLFRPEDLYLIREGAAVRRRFLDECICQLRPRYAAALAEYKRLHEHKTRILRDWGEKPSLLDTLEEFSLGMAQAGALLIHYRAHFLRRLGEEAPAIHRDFSGGRETLSLRYQTVSSIENPEAPPGELLPWLLAHLESHRQAELTSRTCLSGPHKDDLLVEIDGAAAKTYGSQGQTRTAALSLKLAAREIFRRETGEYPVLLLDDVLSELDPRRKEFVLNRIKGGQVFITCCEEERGLEEGAVFHIQNGTLL